MNVRHCVLLVLASLLLSSCANPYSSMNGGSQLTLRNDIAFLEKYKMSLCGIKEMMERNEISRGKCLALYYDVKENDSAKNDVLKRVGYIFSNPDDFDKAVSEQLSGTATKIIDCNNYIEATCK